MSDTYAVSGSLPSIITNEEGLYKGSLVEYFQTVFYKGRNVNNPYHNFRHVCHVIYHCYDACKFYGNKLSSRQVRNLLIASLFHDFDHTGKRVPDSVNISQAIAGLILYLQSEDNQYFEEIAYLIKATEYPHTIPDEEVGLSGLIIRDADLCQALNPAWIQQVVFGLAREWDRTPIEILNSQGDFHSRLVFKTEWARQKFPPEAIQEKINEARALAKLLEL